MVRAMNKPRRLRVTSPHNSGCDSARLADLNFTLAWIDWNSSGFYLHVREGETIHRVFCKHSDSPRLAWKDGVLFWLIDETTEEI